jgi:hypothetical protein
MKKQRPEFEAWCQLLRHQIRANEKAVKMLNLEIEATIRLITAQRQALALAIKAEKKNTP